MSSENWSQSAPSQQPQHSPGQTNDEDLANDAEGVWSPDIEQSFQEALAIYPPCGRRKIILSDEGKMYGRNELIARYIKLRTGKTRTRKQVSSHIQVLARRKSRELQSLCKGQPSDSCYPRSYLDQESFFALDQNTKDKALQSMAAMSSAQIVSATAIHNKAAAMGIAGLGIPGTTPLRPPYPAHQLWQPGLTQAGTSQDISPVSVASVKPFSATAQAYAPGGDYAAGMTPGGPPAWEGRSIGTRKLRLVEFQAFLELQRDPESVNEYNKHLFVHLGSNVSYSDPPLEAVDVRQIYDKFPEKKGGLKELYDKGPPEAFFLVKFWADLNTNLSEETGAFYGVTSQYESPDNMTIMCSTKVCSFGKQVVEKVETEYARFENGRFVYRIHPSPMCEYMINFIHKLKHLPEKYMMNSVLENFTILQVVTNRETQETLLCIAYVFEVSTSEHGAQHHIYRLVKD
ncbi:transcriptional enhancer factor TEF-1-like isoform X4 [Patiria miniata]|uniref:TEA domain-containing protein n=1 Tax=Patiria miniata TaxID=46514 RepID=A0A913ZDC4_PATMI|nr:transcriptional enhancer factor TEF-1-like isoform X4 [Patiria miniata]